MSEIDVSKCIFINKEWETHCDICQELVKTKLNIYNEPRTKCLTIDDVECASYPNCYYKQLQQYKQLCEQKTVDNFDLIKENEELKEELFTIQHNCSREGCTYYDDDTFKVFYECIAQKALQLSANSVTTKYCDLLKTIIEIKKIAEKESFCDSNEILQKIKEVKGE